MYIIYTPGQKNLPPPLLNITYFAVTTANFKVMIDNIAANRSFKIKIQERYSESKWCSDIAKLPQSSAFLGTIFKHIPV